MSVLCFSVYHLVANFLFVPRLGTFSLHRFKGTFLKVLLNNLRLYNLGNWMNVLIPFW